MICDSNIFAGNHHGSVGFGRLSLPVAVHAAKIKQRLCHLRLLCASPDAFSALFVSRWAKLSDFSANASAEHTVAPPPNRCHSGCLPAPAPIPLLPFSCERGPLVPQLEVRE